MGITNLIATGMHTQEGTYSPELNPEEVLHDFELLIKQARQLERTLRETGLLKPEDAQYSSTKVYKGEKRIPVEIALTTEEEDAYEYTLEIVSDTTGTDKLQGRKIMCTYGSRFIDPDDKTLQPAFLNIFVYPKLNTPQKPSEIAFDFIIIEEELQGNTTKQVVKKNTYETGQITQIPFEEVTELLGIIHTMANPNEVTTIL